MRSYAHCFNAILKARKFIFHKVVYFLPSLMFYLTTSICVAQRAKIDSLKAVLVTAHDTARIDCLNILSLVYSYLQTDSADSYARQAYRESSKTNYIRGIAMSLNNQAHNEGLGYRDYPLQEKISCQVILFTKKWPNEKILAAAYMNLSLALFCQSDFEGASAACDSLIQIAQQSRDKKALAEAIAVKGSISFETGDYEKSFQYFNQSLDLFKEIQDPYNTAILLAKIGDFYRLAGEQKAALDFYFQSLKYPQGPSLQWQPLRDLGDTYYALEPYDSAFNEQDSYLQSIKSLTIRSNYMSFPRILQAETNMQRKQYGLALDQLFESLGLSKKNNDKNQLMRSLLDIGKVYEAMNDPKKTFRYTRDLLRDAQIHRAKQYLRDGYQLMYLMYDQLHKPDSAYFYYRQYTYMSQSVALSEFSKKLAIYGAATETEKKKAQIAALSNEKLISQHP